MTAPQASKATNGSNTAFLGSKGPQTPGHDVTSGELPGILGRSWPNFSVPPLVAGSSQAGARELPHILSHPREHPTSRDSPTWPGPFGPIIQTGAFGPFGTYRRVARQGPRVGPGYNVPVRQHTEIRRDGEAESAHQENDTFYLGVFGVPAKTSKTPKTIFLQRHMFFAKLGQVLGQDILSCTRRLRRPTFSKDDPKDSTNRVNSDPNSRDPGFLVLKTAAKRPNSDPGAVGPEKSGEQHRLIPQDVWSCIGTAAAKTVRNLTVPNYLNGEPGPKIEISLLILLHIRQQAFLVSKHLPASIGVNQNIGCYMNIMNRLLLHGFLIKSLKPKVKTDRNHSLDFTAHPPASIDVNSEYIRVMILSGFLTKSLKPIVKTGWNHSPDFAAHPPASFSGV
ncbi:hypothetical protein C8J57DRAFT_1246161 [Mycena rebaudengoi]|nr:hypothetical protein C8J57DRAFT_1246161 [Mycena rebaudengoi]